MRSNKRECDDRSSECRSCLFVGPRWKNGSRLSAVEAEASSSGSAVARRGDVTGSTATESSGDGKTSVMRGATSTSGSFAGSEAEAAAADEKEAAGRRVIVADEGRLVTVLGRAGLPDGCCTMVRPVEEDCVTNEAVGVDGSEGGVDD